MYRTLPFVLIACVIVAVTACKSTEPSGTPAPGEVADAPAPADPDAGFINTRWVLTELNGEPVKPPAPDQPLFLGFTEDGILGGFAGVNYLNARFERRGKQLNIGPVMTTKKAGPPELNAQEVELLKQLMLTTRYRVEDGRLELHRATGTGTALIAVAGATPE